MKIGLEVHVALPTRSKLFCGCSTAETQEPNVNVCPICMGFPGSKPSLNESAIIIAKSIADALKCKIKDKISFVRKVYFYPDLPKSFQITQLQDSIGMEGELTLDSGKSIRIRRVQIEEDPAKIIRGEDHSLIDFNRAGIPLVEIVTEPDIADKDELKSFIFVLKAILYYIGVDIDREIKADLNISLGKERVEIKNVTGTKNLIEAADYEIKRQGELIKMGIEPIKETRSYDERTRTTASSREKETDEEYGYIYEPDLTEYDVKRYPVKTSINPVQKAKELALKHSYSENSILEAIAFDRQALETIEENQDKFEFKTLMQAINEIKRFKIGKLDDESLRMLIDEIAGGFQIDEDVIKSVIEHKKVEHNRVSSSELDRQIREFIDKDRRIIDRYKKNKKLVDYVAGEIIKRYKAQPKEVLKRAKEILDSLVK
ncbi:MAG: hypothetical protein QXJ12_00680 [Candidatus Parvarchaeota archaeon]|nr:hypothetical protein [Candidatus Parvarchaeota archaeon]